MKVQPGSYKLVFTDKNHNNIDVTFWTGGWTLDLRGCTFTNKFDGSVPDSPNPLIYVNQAGPTFTILGGTFWQDVGEIWSQGKVRSIVADPSAGIDVSLVKVEIDVGYDTKVWSDNGAKSASSKTPPAIECVDVSNPDHYTRPDCNFWYMKMDSLSVSNRTATLAATSRTGMKEGHHLAIPLGKSMGTTLVNEDMTGLTGILSPRCSNQFLSSFSLCSQSAELTQFLFHKLMVSPPMAPSPTSVTSPPGPLSSKTPTSSTNLSAVRTKSPE